MGKHYKHLKKHLNFYKINFNFKPPYRVLIDGTFCKAALTNQVNIMEQLPKYLGGQVYYFTTNCVLAECEALGTLLYGPLKILQQFQVYPCKHEKPRLPTKCLHLTLKGMVFRKKQYMVATQDARLTSMVRQMSGVPLLYLSRKTITLEDPKEKNIKVAGDKLASGINPSQDEMKKIRQLKLEAFGKLDKPLKKKRKRKLGNPHPLSCKAKSENRKKKKKMAKKNKKIKMDSESMLATLTQSEAS